MAKAFWLMIVCLGFLGAGFLISKSYSDWQLSPIATSISTHSLKDLEFPSVAVCPPENSNTALNYDLLKAANYSFSKDDRERLKEAIWDSFIAEDHRSFADEMVAAAAANPGSLKQVYDGFQSIPTPYNHGYEIVVWNSSGTISSAWYSEEYSEGHFMKNRDVHIVLAFPANIADLVGSGSLKLELEVDIRQEEGWVEEVQYSEGTPYKAFDDKKTWAEAEAKCQRKGGNLASVLSQWEDREVMEIRKRLSINMWTPLWLGGKMYNNAQCADSEVRNAFERTPFVVVLKFHVFILISKSFNFRSPLERISLRYLTKT